MIIQLFKRLLQNLPVENRIQKLHQKKVPKKNVQFN